MCWDRLHSLGTRSPARTRSRLRMRLRELMSIVEMVSLSISNRIPDVQANLGAVDREYEGYEDDEDYYYDDKYEYDYEEVYGDEGEEGVEEIDVE
jgi:hypothetical protein